MTDIQKEESRKTIVAFVVGLLIGGLLVWAFGSNETTPADTKSDTVITESTSINTEDTEEEDTPAATTTTSAAMTVGDGSVTISNQPASAQITLESVVFPIAEGWIGVRDYNNDILGPILGVVRFSESQGLVPEFIQLQYPTRAGRTYAVVFFNEDGDREFNLATDSQIDKIFATFTAQ
jgi:hypothetical protein